MSVIIEQQSSDSLPAFRSVEGRRIGLSSFGNGKGRTILLMGGVHGDERRAVLMVRRILRKLRKIDPSELEDRIIVMPLVNPDGYKADSRRNSRDVDLNRNFPTKDFKKNKERSGGSEPLSEPESRAIVDVVERFRPELIISLHSDLACVNYNGDLALPVAERMFEICGLEIKGDIGYPCPGSMGTYYGLERQLPVITLELPEEGKNLKKVEHAVMDAIGLSNGSTLNE